jgi:DNA modification methylase
LILKRAVKGNTPNYYYGTHTLQGDNAIKYKIGNGYGSTINIKKTNENIGYDKTIDTYMQLIKPFADEGDLVLDLFAGNFNALKVSRILNLKSISIEKDKNKIQDFLDAQEKYTL